jgi:hypothetical protein
MNNTMYIVNPFISYGYHMHHIHSYKNIHTYYYKTYFVVLMQKHSLLLRTDEGYL